MEYVLWFVTKKRNYHSKKGWKDDTRFLYWPKKPENPRAAIDGRSSCCQNHLKGIFLALLGRSRSPIHHKDDKIREVTVQYHLSIQAPDEPKPLDETRGVEVQRKKALTN